MRMKPSNKEDKIFAFNATKKELETMNRSMSKNTKYLCTSECFGNAQLPQCKQ